MKYTRHVEYILDGGRPRLRFNYKPILATIARYGVPRTKSVTVYIRYTTNPD